MRLYINLNIKVRKMFSFIIASLGTEISSPIFLKLSIFASKHQFTIAGLSIIHLTIPSKSSTITMGHYAQQVGLKCLLYF